jgi:hypothetical protein
LKRLRRGACAIAILTGISKPTDRSGPHVPLSTIVRETNITKQ